MLLASAAAAQGVPQFPVGTTQFFGTGASDAVAALGGGAWVATAGGIARYTAAGRDVVLPTPGGRPSLIAAAADGSIWFARHDRVGRIAADGTVLEQYALEQIRDIALATDGALWYSRGTLGAVIGRIANGSPTEFASPNQSLSLAAALDGEMWILSNGFGNATETLYRMAPGGAAIAVPQTFDTLFGSLQSLTDGTLYIGAGLDPGLFRLRAGAQVADRVRHAVGPVFLVGPDGDIWWGNYWTLGYVGATGAPEFRVPMPHDPRDCSNAPLYMYRPLAVDADGGLWVLVIPEQPIFIPPGPPPCPVAAPPFPDLLRIDIAQFLDAHTPVPVPMLSPALLILLAVGISCAAVFAIRRS